MLEEVTSDVSASMYAAHIARVLHDTHEEWHMPKQKIASPLWFDAPEDHNYPAAESYLSLIYPSKRARSLVAKLRAARLTSFKAKDIFRASQLSLLGVSNSHVDNDKKKIMAGKQLSPILLIRDAANGRVIIADGYHRLCAVYGFDEDASIPCKIA